jgi:hypothetical protein
MNSPLKCQHFCRMRASASGATCLHRDKDQWRKRRPCDVAADLGRAATPDMLLLHISFWQTCETGRQVAAARIGSILYPALALALALALAPGTGTNSRAVVAAQSSQQAQTPKRRRLSLGPGSWCGFVRPFACTCALRSGSGSGPSHHPQMPDACQPGHRRAMRCRSLS